MEEVTVLSRHVDDVVCRWCGHGRGVVEIADADADDDADADADVGAADGGAGS